MIRITVFLGVCIAGLACCMLAHAQDSGTDSFVIGADISFFDQLSSNGAVYQENGAPKDLLSILKDNGVNTIRLRLWHTPEEEWNALERTLLTAKSIQEAGLDFLLDIHYSDTWADPGKQTKPAVWQGASFDALTDSVYSYTYNVLNLLKVQGTAPKYIQVGNEISVGLLWDEGRVGGQFDTASQWNQLGTLLNAAIEAIRDVFVDGSPPAIIIHTDHGGNKEAATWFFENLEEEGVLYDIIGLSYYPFWHGSLLDVEETLGRVATRFGKPVLLVETAYPWTLGWFDNVNNIIGLPEHVLPGFEATPEGQYDFLKTLIDIVKQTPSAKGLGMVYWAPEYIAVPGVGSPWENMTLFDEKGVALKGLEAFREELQSVHIEADERIQVDVSSILLYPNPFTDVINLSFESAQPERMAITIISLLGREVSSHSMTTPSGKHTIQVYMDDVPPGLYLYKGYIGNRPVSGTIIKGS